MLHWSWLAQFQGKYWNYTKKQADPILERFICTTRFDEDEV